MWRECISGRSATHVPIDESGPRTQRVRMPVVRCVEAILPLTEWPPRQARSWSDE